jgi:hypothetical protein
MNWTLAGALTRDDLQRHPLAQAMASAFGIFVLVCHFNHLLLQFHQPTVRQQIVPDRFPLLR